MWRAHGLGVEAVEGLVACSGTPPRFYPNVVTVDPAVDVEAQKRLIFERAERASGTFSVKDSYRALELGSVGFRPLFDACWIRRVAGMDGGATQLDWRPVTDPFDELSAWEAAWSNNANEPRLFLPAFLLSPGVTMLAGRANGAIVAGCIVTARGAVAGFSNVFGDSAEVTRGAAKTFPSCDLVGYENGEALAAALKAGFEMVGELTVWRRQ